MNSEEVEVDVPVHTIKKKKSEENASREESETGLCFFGKGGKRGRINIIGGEKRIS